MTISPRFHSTLVESSQKLVTFLKDSGRADEAEDVLRRTIAVVEKASSGLSQSRKISSTSWRHSTEGE